jgi:hypothetical protein
LARSELLALPGINLARDCRHRNGCNPVHTFVSAGSGISVGIPTGTTFTGIHNNDFQSVGDDFNFQNLTTAVNIDLTTASWGRGIWSDGNSSDLEITANTFANTRSGINLDSYNDVTHHVRSTVEGKPFEEKPKHRPPDRVSRAHCLGNHCGGCRLFGMDVSPAAWRNT